MMKKSMIAAIALGGVALVGAARNECLAGRYSTGSGYSTSAYRPASPVYGFAPSGRSFTYQPSGGAPSTSGSRGTPGSSTYGPQYRTDAFTRPQTSTTTKMPTYDQPYYFSGRMWYPRNN